ncbi:MULTISPECIES: riboflavin synthase [unclassified Bacillus (in: firmicutes)]|uniref:riboflavin synthase n=1 Tax=unclassified Bacillus (in: firmicutes) TaxID=185979 RepID=UPI0008E6CD3D|nr:MULTISPECIES: riboflavin synthase [unclassified Bacillus (in: firmicutes)]SFA81315.1 riboflavin synthase alpha chain [Bacillus sp. UNCCL13]SFQ71424.1 riboflavin synthase alpha chain [Bacillus sp. cl95]
MFTGIVEEIGEVTEIKLSRNSFNLRIAARKILGDVKLGDSIAINGVCLTVTSFSHYEFTVDVMPETIKVTSLNRITRGSKVNLERAMAADGRFGGHFVSGHIDGVGMIKNKKRLANAVYYEIEADEELLHYIILKGSVAVDGTSLTVFDVTDQSFTVSLIPHTVQETIIGQKEMGDFVNVECNMLGKYVGHFMSNKTSIKKEKSISAQFLEDNGFL